MAVKDWSTNADNNTTIANINIAEHCPARNLNNAIRAVMAESKEKFNEIDTKPAVIFRDWE